ncbi:MAG: DUF5715 family protein [Muribaculaceae bacterium]
MKQLSLVLLIMMMVGACGSGGKKNGDAQQAESANIDSATLCNTTEQRISGTQGKTVADTPSCQAKAIVHSIPVHIVPGRLRSIFNDTNGTHLAAAESLGIKPIRNLSDAYHLRTPIVRIATNENYTVDELTHSMPFLVPKAAQLLNDIGRRFADTIRARGGHEYRIKVTSVLRTDRSVAKLRRRNRNASEQSAHCYGTTFDISYAKFICCDSTFIVSLADLKNILGEILYDERQKGRCYVKFEVKQGCFHITARP